jgi:flagellar biosynthesis protein FlhF
MQVERFQARTMKEALALVKQQLGENAVVLGTRTVRAGGLGLLGERMYEVSALPWDSADAARDPSPGAAQAAGEPAITVDDIERAVAPLRQEILSLRAQLRGMSDPLRRDLRRTIEELRATFGAVSGGAARGPDAEIRRTLEAAGVGPELAAAVVDEARSRLGDEPIDDVEERAVLLTMAEQAIGRRLSVRAELPAAGSRPRAVALVGPTGVGKTTTIAELASLAALVDGRAVVLATMDTYRVGAVEQLRRYATLIGVPLVVAADGKALRLALQEHAEAEMVLIDTPGRSWAQPGALDGLAGALAQAGEPVQVQLVVPAAMRIAEIDAVLRHYEGLKPERLIVTKADEAVYGGSVLECCVRSGLPVSFVCNGQRVPEDIAPASTSWIAGFVMGREEN